MNSLILLLCRKPHIYIKSLHSIFKLNKLNSVIISDSPSPSNNGEITFSDSVLFEKNMIGLTYLIDKKPNAWDKAFYYVFNNHLPCDYFYFIEDDVLCRDPKLFLKLINLLYDYPHDLIAKCIEHKEDSKWNHWGKNDLNLPEELNGYLCRSYNPFCRLSKRLINAIYNFYRSHHRLIFHEILFPSVCYKNNMTWTDWEKDPNIREFFGVFKYVNGMNGSLKGDLT